MPTERLKVHAFCALLAFVVVALSFGSAVSPRGRTPELDMKLGLYYLGLTLTGLTFYELRNWRF